jgi:hypothetical protein
MVPSHPNYYYSSAYEGGKDPPILCEYLIDEFPLLFPDGGTVYSKLKKK